MNATNRSIKEVIAVIRDFAGLSSDYVITAETRIDADLGITGDDGIDLLRAVEARFDTSIGLTDGSLRRVFGLGENEFLFGPEGLEIPFVGSLYRWITGRRPPVIHDLTVGELFVAVKESSCDTEGDRLADAGS